MNTHDQVVALLGKMKAAAKNPAKMEEISDQIELLTSAYMAPSLPADPLPGVRMTPNEAMLLRMLIAREGQSVSREALLNSTWHRNQNPPEPKILDVYICRLRKRVKSAGYAIENIWGKGYRLIKSDPQHAQGKAA